MRLGNLSKWVAELACNSGALSLPHNQQNFQLPPFQHPLVIAELTSIMLLSATSPSWTEMSPRLTFFQTPMERSFRAKKFEIILRASKCFSSNSQPKLISFKFVFVLYIFSAKQNQLTPNT